MTRSKWQTDGDVIGIGTDTPVGGAFRSLTGYVETFVALI